MFIGAHDYEAAISKSQFPQPLHENIVSQAPTQASTSLPILPFPNHHQVDCRAPPLDRDLTLAIPLHHLPTRLALAIDPTTLNNVLNIRLNPLNPHISHGSDFISLAIPVNLSVKSISLTYPSRAAK